MGGECQGSLQVPGHDLFSGGGGAQGQQLPGQMGGLKQRRAACRGHQGTSRPRIPHAFHSSSLYSLYSFRSLPSRAWHWARQRCYLAKRMCLPTLLGSACSFMGRCEGRRLDGTPCVCPPAQAVIEVSSWADIRTE